LINVFLKVGDHFGLSLKKTSRQIEQKAMKVGRGMIKNDNKPHQEDQQDNFQQADQQQYVSSNPSRQEHPTSIQDARRVPKFRERVYRTVCFGTPQHSDMKRKKKQGEKKND
jgi:hypothetical protein